MDYTLVSENELPPKILFLAGAPCCGKGTQSEKIIHKYKYKYFSTGELFREELKKGGELATRLKEYMDKGALVPEELVIDVMVKGMKGKNDKILVDGFPRNTNQALIYEQKFRELFMIMLFEVQENALYERLAKRVADTPVELQRGDDKPEILTTRIKTFMSESMKAVNFYNRLGKVRIVNAMNDPENVFKQAMEVLIPTMVCITGPPCVGKTTLARKIQSHMQYGYVDFYDFCKHRNLKTCEEKAMELMRFLDRIPSRNFVIDGFPESAKQAKILFESFGLPLKLFFLEAEKDEVHNRIHSYSQSQPTVTAEELKVQFDYFLSHKELLHGFVKDKSFFHDISGHQSIESIFTQCRDALSPVVHFINKGENKELFKSYVMSLEENGFIFINLEKTIEAQIMRGLDIGQKLKEDKSYENIFEMLRRIIYLEPLQNKKYLISNFPNSLEFLQRFSNEVCPFKLLLHFNKTEGADIASQSQNYPEEWMNIVGNYHSSNKLVGIGVKDLGIVDFHSEKRNRYGLITGPVSVGKTTIAKTLHKSGYATVVFFEKFKEECIKRLTKDDVAPDDVPLSAMFAELNKDMQAAPADKIFLLDGFSWGENNLETLTKICGDPIFVLRLDVSDEVFNERFMKKNNITSLSDEDTEILTKSKQANDALSHKLADMVSKNTNFRIFDIDASGLLYRTIEGVKAIFFKRIFVARVTSKSADQKALKHTLAWLCAKYDYQFIDMEAVQHEARQKHPYGLKDLRSVLDLIKNQVDSNRKFTRNILIFNYLQADLEKGESNFYPNSKDEVFYLEQNIGSIRACFSFVDQPEEKQVERIMVPKKIEEPKIVRQNSGDDNPPVDEEEEKKKFKPEEYDWSELPSKPTTFPQFFFEMRHPNLVDPNNQD